MDGGRGPRNRGRIRDRRPPSVHVNIGRRRERNGALAIALSRQLRLSRRFLTGGATHSHSLHVSTVERAAGGVKSHCIHTGDHGRHGDAIAYGLRECSRLHYVAAGSGCSCCCCCCPTTLTIQMAAASRALHHKSPPRAHIHTHSGRPLNTLLLIY